MTQTCRYALVLTTDPILRGLSQAHTAAALMALDGATDLASVEVREPAPGVAWQAIFPSASVEKARGVCRTLERTLAGQPLDINLANADTPCRRKRVLVADMESTIIEQEMLDELGDLIGKRDVIEDITARAMRGELDFEAALKARVSMLAGLDAGVLDEVAKRITIMPGALELVATMKANGAWCALVSGGFTFFTERIARQLGFDVHQANTLEIVDNKITGRVLEPILGREAKLEALRRIAAERGVNPADCLAVGDGANDLAMLGAAGLGVAFRAKPKVREAALSSPGGAVVTNGDLTALLYLQGYGVGDFVS